MQGGWSLLRWNVPARELTLLLSEVARDPIFFATDGRRLAVAPEMLQLCGLPWVGRVLDPEGFALSVGRARLVRIRGTGTPWKGVKRVLSGVRATFSAAGRVSVAPAEPAAIQPWRGSFDDAVDALNVLCRRIVGQNMRRAGRSAFLLSGGLDSSLLAALGAEERAPGAEMFCLSSVSPDGSSVPDEFEFSSAVARQLGLEQHRVVPDAAADPFRPAPSAFAWAQQPVVGPRNYLDERLRLVAQAHGAHAVVGGVGGEFSITHKPPLGSNLWLLRRWRFQAMLWWETRSAQGLWPESGFHVKLAPQMLAALPREWKDVWREGLPRPSKRMQGKPVGVHPGTRKTAYMGTALADNMRSAVPYFDPRLLRLAGTFPSEFFQQHGETRALARAMLRGRVPEAVRTRQSGLPYSPDYRQRMRDSAAHAQTRMDAWRAAHADEWVDLPWLGRALEDVGSGRANVVLEGKAQMTAHAAEFLTWLQS